MTLDQIVERFDGARPNGKGGYLVRCPAHPDDTASLAVDPGDKGGVILYCHAGCKTGDVLAAAGLTLADLQPEPATSGARIIAEYSYTDAAGVLLFQVVRYDPKGFRQRRPNGAGGWSWRLDGVRRVLFGLPALQGQKRAFVVEGEKDALGLAALGLVATCNSGGAGKWIGDFTRQLKTAGVQSVIVLPDNDEPGRQHGRTVAASCASVGLIVKVIDLPGLPPKGDVSDWFAAGHTRAELEALEAAAPIFRSSTAAAEGLELTGLSDLLAEPDETVDYLVADRVPCGSVVILAGKPKAGKSTAARALALEVARGGSWLGCACLPRPVWYLALEDKRSEVRRHFRMMGAGAEPVRFVFRQPADDLIARLHTLAAREHPGLIVVDTLQRLIKANDLNDYAETTAKLTPILTLARETGAAVLLVHHAGKAERQGLDAVLGSTALAGSADNVLILSRTDRYRLLSSIQRIGPDLPETVITLDLETGRVSAGLTRHEADRGSIEALILAALTASPEQTRAEIDAAVEGRKALKAEALRVLLETGRLCRSGRGGKADPYRYAIVVPKAGNHKTATDQTAADSGSGSQVPVYTREPENHNRDSEGSLSNSEKDCGSQVPGMGESPTEPREPQNMAAQNDETEGADDGIF